MRGLYAGRGARRRGLGFCARARAGGSPALRSLPPETPAGHLAMGNGAWQGDDPQDTIHHAAWALRGILNWRFWLGHRQKNPYEQQQHGNTNHYTAKRHFMTRETFLATVMSVSTRILMFPLYRGELDGAGSFVGDETTRMEAHWKPRWELA